ncbi:NitT/TauT family transport system permease protein [Granulicella aggregans]|uniref:NitT/TauT family transport system permease protein n=1 Tax=Granulicella aggregans TaxID=474949 RepID=A0A7W8E3W9_9BACT|nr:ABC transporter permease [Granulicella aggregans]MBB5057679.1 NitT/TauT family transport system permease protein [Granulicella aggregans]
MKTLRTIAQALIILAGILLVWQGIVWLFNLKPYIFPAPLDVLKAIEARYPELLASLSLSAAAAAAGLFTALIAGVGIALIFAQSPWVRKMFYPYTILLQTVPIIAVAPLIIMWIGPGLFAVTLITFIICLAPIIANTTLGLISIDRNLVDLFLMHNASRGQILFKLRMPHALPSIFTGIRISSGIAVIGALTGELFAGSSRVGQGGIGYAIQYASAQTETPYLFALVLAASALGFAFFFIVMGLEWYFLHEWHESARSTDVE